MSNLEDSLERQVLTGQKFSRNHAPLRGSSVKSYLTEDKEPFIETETESARPKE